jgi:hypothetical protein
MQLGWVSIYTEGTCLTQFSFAIATAQQSNTEHAGSSCSQQIPNGIAHNIALVYTYAHALLARQEEIGFRFGTRDTPALDNDGFCRDAKHLERSIDLGAVARCGNPKQDIACVQELN